MEEKGNPAGRIKLFNFASEFDKQVEIEIMKGERLRSTLLCGAFIILALLYSLMFLFFKPVMLVVFNGKLNGIWPAAVFLALAAYEFGFRSIIGIFMRKERRFPIPPRYVNAILEISLPTLALLFYTNIFNPVLALQTPPLLIYFIFISLSAMRLDYRLSLFSGTIAAIEYLILSYYCITRPDSSGLDPILINYAQHAAKSVIIFLSGAVTAFVTFQIHERLIQQLRFSEEKNKIASIFGQHVSPAVMEKLLNQKSEILSETRHVCVLFLDIRNFTTYSQNRAPEEVVGFLNILFDFMIDIINKHNGIINKFLGDGFMAVFGAPLSDGRESVNAVRASIEMIERVQKEVEEKRIEPTRIGIGLHAGEAVTGNIGSARRKEYTVIGDVVNVASRIESLNKQFNSQFLISEAVWNAASKNLAEAFPGRDISKPEELAKPLGPVNVKGREEAVKVYQVV